MVMHQRIFYPLAVFILLFVNTLASADSPTDPSDVRRADAAQAIINYQAQLAEKERLHRLTPPPGLQSVANTGEALTLYYNNQSSYTGFLGGSASTALGYQMSPSTVDPHLQYFQANAKNTGAIEAGTLLNSTNLGNADQLASAKILVQNLTNAFPTLMSNDLQLQLQKMGPDPDPAVLAGLGLPQQVEYIDRQMAQAIYSTAQRALNDLIALRLPIPHEPNQRSILDVMQQESTWRMQDANWLENLAISPADSTLRELAQMEAIRLWMDYQRYRQAEQTQVLLATLLANQARMGSYMTKTFQDMESMRIKNGG